MTTPIALTMVDGVRVVVPDSIELITTYVLREQHDWCEDEIKFLRRLLQAGQKVIDIGANYGVYTLAMAKLVGPTGHVWAFEPASATAKMLAAGIAANGFDQVTILQSAVSSAPGSAQLSLNDNAELNALQHGQDGAGATETVPLVTLDECMESLDWRGIDFMKIDAEGEEISILRGAARFLASESPLVQYEIKVSEGPNMDLVRAFTEIGYHPYRLVPGLDILVPFDATKPADSFLLNLFGCKPDRAARLAASGYLLEEPLDAQDFRKRWRGGFFKRLWTADKYHWRAVLAQLPYGKALAGHWEKTIAAGRSSDVEEALSLYGLAQDAGRATAQRFAALEASLTILRRLCDDKAAYLRRSSLARVARDYGARTLAAKCLHRLSVEIAQERRFDPTEPFLTPSKRFDQMPPGENISAWICAAALEESERTSAFSSYYTANNSRQNLQSIRDLGFGSDEMKRRLELIELRYGPD